MEFNKEDPLEYCHHNDTYPGQHLIVGICKYCAANELGELMRADLEQSKKAAAYFKAYRERKLWR